MPTVNEKQYVKLTSRMRELQALLSQCAEATVIRIGKRVEKQAERNVPVITGKLRESIHMNVRRTSVTVGTGMVHKFKIIKGRRVERGYRYGALVEGIVKPLGRSYTSTPFLRPAFERVLNESRNVLMEEARKRASRMG